MLGASSLLPVLLLLAAEPSPAEPAAPASTATTASTAGATATVTEASAGPGLVLPLAAEGQLAAARPLPRLPEAYTLRPERNWLVPLLEVPALNLTIASWDRWVLRADWAQVDMASIRANLDSVWVIDSDDAWVNFVGHPYHGTLAFNAARSSGLTFWESIAFPLVSSTVWEVAGETEPPSLNDNLLTITSGVFLGEAFHRTAQLLLDGTEQPGPLQQLLAFAVDPLGGVNRQVFGRRVRRGALPELPPYEVRLLVGGTAFGPSRLSNGAGVDASAPRLQPYVGVELTYGFPGTAGRSVRLPFDYFRLQAAAGLPGALTGDLHLHGLVVGKSLGAAEGPLHGAWGVFGSHDFGTGPGFRVATTALGLGSALQLGLGGRARLRATGIVSGALLGGAGTFAEMDHVDTGEFEHPLYSAGPGGQLLLDVELAHPALGALGVTSRSFRLTGMTPGRGWERVDLLGARGLLRVAPGHQLGAELLLGRRHADADGGTRQEGALGRVFWVVELERAPRP